MGIQFVHRRMVATEAQISYIQSLYYSLRIALVTKMISKNEYSPVSKAWVNHCGCMEQKLSGARYTEIIFSERENVKPCGNTWAKGKMGESGCIKDGG